MPSLYLPLWAGIVLVGGQSWPKFEGIADFVAALCVDCRQTGAFSKKQRLIIFVFAEKNKVSIKNMKIESSSEPLDLDVDVRCADVPMCTCKLLSRRLAYVQLQVLWSVQHKHKKKSKRVSANPQTGVRWLSALARPALAWLGSTWLSPSWTWLVCRIRRQINGYAITRKKSALVCCWDLKLEYDTLWWWCVLIEGSLLTIVLHTFIIWNLEYFCQCIW